MTGKEAGRALLRESLTRWADEHDAIAAKCRDAYTAGPLFVAARRLADIHFEVAAVLREELAKAEAELT